MGISRIRDAHLIFQLLPFADADGEAAAGGHFEFEDGLGGDFLGGDSIGVGVIGVVGDAGGVFAVAVDDGVVGFARGEEVELDAELAGILVGDAAEVPGV